MLICFVQIILFSCCCIRRVILKVEKIRSFVVEGNIGTGKSTLIEILKKNLNVDIVFEPIKKWQSIKGEQNLLDLFYKDIDRWAYTFQSYAFVTRVLEQEENFKKNVSGIQVLERSVYSDRYCFAKNCFELGKLTAMEWELYKEWFKWLVEGYTKRPDGFIYLKTKPEVCYSRILKRNRQEESAVPLDYIKLLHNKHENWLVEKIGVEEDNFISEVPVLSLECNNDFENCEKEQERLVRNIASFLGIDSSYNLQNSSKNIDRPEL